MYKTLFIAFLLLSVSFASKNKAHSKSHSKVKAHTERKSPSDLLLDHLDGVEGRLRGEQLKENEIYDSQTVECNAEKEARAQAIQDATDSLKRAQNHYVRCDSALHQTKADLAQIKKFITEIKFNQQALKINREREAKEFNELLTKELDPALAAIQQAYPIIDELTQSETSFVDVTHKLTTMFIQLTEADKGAMMAPLLAAFVSLGGDFSESDVEAIRRLFEQLEQDLISVKNDALRIEEDR